MFAIRFYGCIPLFAVFSLFLHAASAALIVSDVKLRCERENIRANLIFDEPFNGVMFAKDFFDRDACKIIGKGEKELALILPLVTEQSDSRFCGAKAKNNVVSLKLVFSSAQQILVAGAREIELQCEYRFSPITVTAPNGALNIRPNNEPLPVIIGHQLRDDPAISMLIREGHGIDGPSVVDAGIGQNITLDIFSDSFDFYLHDCYAFSEKRDSDAQKKNYSMPNIRFIDDKGCLMGEQRISQGPVRKKSDKKDQKHAYVYLQGFQFHNSQSVHFECQVRPCPNAKCATENCQKVSEIVANAVEITSKSKTPPEDAEVHDAKENSSWLDKVFQDTEQQRYLQSGRQKDASILDPIIRNLNGPLILREEEEISLDTTLQMKPRGSPPEASAIVLSDGKNRSQEASQRVKQSRPFQLEENSLLPAGTMALASVFLTAMICLFAVILVWYCKKMRAEEGRQHNLSIKVDSKQLVLHDDKNQSNN